MAEVFVLHGLKTHGELLPLLHAADAFVAPYVEVASGDKDGVPTAMLEAMSTGLPVVATDAGSIREVLDDGVEGRVVRQRDPHAMAAALEELAREPGEAVAMGRRATQRFAREFDVAVTEGRLHERIRALLQ